MKAAPFRYHRPADLTAALRTLAAVPGARPLAGGQSLMAMLNFRVANCDDLIDLARIPELAGLHEDGDALVLGAMLRQQDIADAPRVAARLPLMTEALAQVGHRQTRNWGTLGGSLCHLDPAAELPAVAAAFGAELEIRSARGGLRRLAMRAFALDLMTTALAPDELLTAVRITPWPPAHGWAFLEFARRRGDFALASAAVLLTLATDGSIDRLAIVLGGVASVPLRLDRLAATLHGRPLDAPALAAVAAACQDIEMLDDPQTPAWYRRQLSTTLLRRALLLAASRAGGVRKAA